MTKKLSNPQQTVWAAVDHVGGTPCIDLFTVRRTREQARRAYLEDFNGNREAAAIYSRKFKTRIQRVVVSVPR